MRYSFSKFFCVLMVVASFVTVQSVWAKKDLDCSTLLEEYYICAIDYDANSIDVSLNCADTEATITTIFGIPIDYLAEKNIIDLEAINNAETEVTINAHECAEDRLMACDLSYDLIIPDETDGTTTTEITIELRQGALGQGQKAVKGNK